MSNVGQAALTIVGTVVGTYFGYPQLGFILGSLVGNAIFPTKLPGQTGPRLQDAKTTIAQVGAPVMEVFGTDSVPGVVMWMAPISETSNTEEVGGKGGPSQESTTFSYNQSIAIGLCRGPMGGLLRVWENGKLVYDTRPQFDDETDDQFLTRIMAAQAYSETFTLYLGGETQLPDPTIELYRGVGEVPAFRGLMYLVYTDRLLLEEQGLRHPNFKFEVTAAVTTIGVLSNEVLHPWRNNVSDPRNPLNVNLYVAPDGTGLTYPFIQSYELNDFINAYAQENEGVLYSQILDYVLHLTESSPHVLYGGQLPSHYEHSELTIHGYPVQPDQVLTAAQLSALTNNTNDLCSYITPIGHGPAGEIFYSPAGLTVNTAVEVSDPAPPLIPPFTGTTGCGVYDAGYVWWQFLNNFMFVEVHRSPGAPAATGWDMVYGTFRVLQGFVSGGRAGEAAGRDKYPLNPCLPDNDPRYDDEAFWTAAYDQAVLDDLMDPGYDYGNQYPVDQDFAWLGGNSQTGDPVSLAYVVQQICARCKVASVDVTDLVDRFANGYTITRVMSGRDAIDPLRNVGFFDVVESGLNIKFATRGKAVVRNLEVSDLGSHEAGSETPPAVKVNKTQDVDLPRVIRVHYKATSRDYEDGEQISPSRSTTRAINDLDLEIAVALPDDQAAKVAETLWSDAWQGRTTYEANLDSAHFDLEPGDAVTLPVDGFRERARIISSDDSIPLLRMVTFARDDDGSYVAEAIADPPGRTPGRMTILSTSDILFLDLPPLRFTDNDAGIYVTVRPTTPGATWRGAQIFLSTDEGVSFISVATVATEPATGFVDVPLPTGDPLVWDDSATLTVTLVSGSLESRSEADVLAGANALAIGVHGRWEIIQFTTVVQTDVDTYVLSHLLRGRRGTEYVMGSGSVGDDAVLVSGLGIARVPLTNADINVVRIYKAVTLGMTYASGLDENFATGAKALLPFSPVMIEGVSDPDTGDMLVSWLRRDRLGQELQPSVALPMSEIPESYEVDIRAAGSPVTPVVRTLPSSIQSVPYTALQQADDFGSGDIDIQIDVYQMSPVLGRGTRGTGFASLLSNDVVYPVVTAEITLSGTFDTSQSFQVTVLFTPRSGAPVNVVSSVNGTGKTSFDDMAIELASELDAGLPATVIVSRVGAVVTVSTTAGFLSATATQTLPPMIASQIQEPSPITAGAQQFTSVDLYVSDWPVSVRAPDSDASYQNGGSASFNFRVYGLDWVTNKALNGGVNQNCFWSIPNGVFNYRIQALDDLGPAIMSQMPTYVDFASYGSYIGSLRPGIIIRAKPGYAIEFTAGSNFSNAGAHPAGYTLEIEQLVAGAAPYPAGAKQRITIYIGTLPVAPATGMVATIMLDGIPYSHTITAPEAADPYGPGFDTVYDDFKTQIEASGDFDVYLYQDGDTPIFGVIDIERNVIDTPFTFSAFFETDLTIGIIIT